MDTPAHETPPLAGDLMTASIPRLSPNATVSAALTLCRQARPARAQTIYVVDAEHRLLGQVPLETIVAAPPEQPLGSLLAAAPLQVQRETTAEAAALLAVRRPDSDIAVVDRDHRLVGAIPIGRLLAHLHEEQIDDLLRKSGIGPAHPEPHESQNTFDAFRARVPWLMTGLLGGWMAAGIAHSFEAILQEQIALAFFLPLVVYMADAVGTQTETVLVRSLAYGPVPLGTQLLREGGLGALIGLTVGLVAGIGLLLVDGRQALALVIGLTLFSTSLVATLVASALPLWLSRMGADPALASGPIATVAQDLLSVAIYLGIATALL